MIENEADTNEAMAEVPAQFGPRWHLYTFTGFMVAAVLIGVSLHAGFGQVLLSMVTVMFACVIALIAMVALAIHASRRQFARHKRSSLIALAIAAELVFATFVALLVGSVAEKAYIKRAKAWCELQIPAIEAYKSEHGTYPKQLADVVERSSVPWVVSTFDPWIRGDEDGFSIDLSTNLTHGWSYWSRSGLWDRYN